MISSLTLIAAQTCESVDGGICTTNGDKVVTLQWFETVFSKVSSVVLALAGIALFLMLLKGGFGYLTSGGESKAVESAKKSITYAIMGIVLIAASYLILVFISNFTGIPFIKEFVIRR